jgi:PilZ domain
MASKFEEPEWKRLLNKRRSRRDEVSIRADLLVSSGPRFKVSVIDLSRTGFRMETGNFIPPETRVYLAIPNMQSLQARIAWQDTVYYGCEFTQPLHESIFNHIAKQYPLLIR